MILATTFRKNLRAAVKSHPLTTKAISQRAGYDYAYVRKVLSGSMSNPTLLFVESLAGALGIPPTDLFKDTGGLDD